jgi:3-phytase
LAPRPRAAGPKVAAVAPDRETAPVPSSGDAADDPAILVGASGTVWIAGTNKRSGLHIYDLSGRELHRIDRGRLNNVDVLELDRGGHLLAASNRTHLTLDLFLANVEEGRIEFAAELPLALNDPYGLCMGRRTDGSMVVFVGGTDGAYQMWAVDPDSLRGQLVREFAFESQTEGCVYDSVTGTLYVGEEARGVWAVEPESGRKRLFARAGDGVLVPDVEGLDIYRDGETAWLIVSSQGDDSYVIYPLPEGRAPVKFRIAADIAAGIDGASETDGLAVSSRPIAGYPSGLLVVQDGRNRAPVEAQNFKLVDWRKIAALLDARDSSD